MFFFHSPFSCSNRFFLSLWTLLKPTEKMWIKGGKWFFSLAHSSACEFLVFFLNKHLPLDAEHALNCRTFFKEWWSGIIWVFYRLKQAINLNVIDIQAVGRLLLCFSLVKRLSAVSKPNKYHTLWMSSFCAFVVILILLMSVCGWR